MSAKQYGKTQTEIDVDKLRICRQIVKNIVKFGVDESQKLQIVYLLALEMENRISLEMITETVKNIKNNNDKLNFEFTKDKSEDNLKKGKILSLD